MGQMMVHVARNRTFKGVGTGPPETSQWLAARGLFATIAPWRVSITLHAKDSDTTQLLLVIDRNEWGVRFNHENGVSWIRVTNAPTIQERDDFGLMPQLPRLRSIGKLIQSLEDRFEIEFRRPHASIVTNLNNAEQKLLLWVIASL